MGNDDVKNKMGNDDHSHISAFLMVFRRVRGLILKRFDISSKVLTSVSQYGSVYFVPLAVMVRKMAMPTFRK